MACACGSKPNAPEVFVVKFADGTKKAYSSKVEANAAIARKGNGQIQ